MKIEHFEIGQIFYRAEIFRNGREIDSGTGDAFTTRIEAKADGAKMAAGYDPEWQKRNPAAITATVRKWMVSSVDEDGSLGSATTSN